MKSMVTCRQVPSLRLCVTAAAACQTLRRREPNFNRSFELSADNPRGGVLLLHGLNGFALQPAFTSVRCSMSRATGSSACDYRDTALSRLRLNFHAGRIWRLQLAWRWRISSRRSVRGPVHIAGYSNGAALALDHALASIDDPELPKPASLILISPSIGGVRGLRPWRGQPRQPARYPALDGFAWTQTTVEFDPYKYNSFPVNGGAIARRLTQSVASRIAKLSQTDQAASFPPVLVFKSAVDATVSIDAVVDRLLARLPDNGNELVLFDINRSAVHSILLVSDPGPITSRLMQDDSLPFAITLVANDSPTSASIVTRFKPPFSAEVTHSEDLDLEWPQGIISLSHVALPFAPDDPLYGQFRPQERDALYLGQIAIRGERGLMKLSNDWLLRLRFNPFYSILENRVTEWVFTKEQ